MNNIDQYIIIAITALIHSSFHLNVGLITLMSGHAIGKNKSHKKLLSFMLSFIFGTTLMIMFILSSLIYFHFGLLFKLNEIPSFEWIIAFGLLIGTGICVMIFYFKKQPGTKLWLPEYISKMLQLKARKVNNSFDAFGLGLIGTLFEIIFIFTPLFIASLQIVQLSFHQQIIGIILYLIIATAPLFVFFVLVGGGTSISRIQKWREENKRFLQLISGIGLILLSGYFYVTQVLSITKNINGG